MEWLTGLPGLVGWAGWDVVFSASDLFIKAMENIVTQGFVFMWCFSVSDLLIKAMENIVTQGCVVSVAFIWFIFTYKSNGKHSHPRIFVSVVFSGSDLLIKAMENIVTQPLTFLCCV